MDVPFISSGAMSRAQYALVRKVELATTPQSADQLLLAEIDFIRTRLGLPTLTLKQCKENLILLLYCITTLSPGLTVDVDFALAHAVGLAEAGSSVQDKRIGYLFCTEVMPPNHELQLMLVNTLRKDLESLEVPRICLALDTLIQYSSEDAIPAIQSRLHDLLSHNSSHVRRRALFVFHRLQDISPEINKSIAEKTRKRLSDEEPLVFNAALTLYADFKKSQDISPEQFHATITTLLRETSRVPENSFRTFKLLSLLPLVKASKEDMDIIFQLIRASSIRGSTGLMLLYQCFLAISNASPELIVAAQSASGTTLVNFIRHILTAEDPNHIYIFLSCLECIDSKLWAGTTSDIPAILEEWEVDRVMELLESGDASIRKKVLHVLNQVDSNILQSLYTQLIQGGPLSSAHNSEETTKRLLEIIEVICEGHGELYAQHLKNILHALEGEGPLDRRQVLEEAIETVLIHVRAADFDFRSEFIGASFASIGEEGLHIGSTLMVILCALVTEYLDSSPVSPTTLLKGVASRILNYAASVKDACLLVMLRVAAECDEIPSEVTDNVQTLSSHSGRHLRRRCEQFLTLSRTRDVLKQIVSKTKSSSLPDFLVALETFQVEERTLPPVSQSLHSNQSPKSPPRISPTPHKLRYEAYEAPVPRQSLRRLSNDSSRRSDVGSPRLSARGSSIAGDDSLSRTMTPGELTLAAGLPLQSPSKTLSHLFGTPSPRAHGSVGHIPPSLAAPDLISLDTPFILEPTAQTSSAASSVVEPNFESVWNGLEKGFSSRGWCEKPIDAIVRDLQALAQPLTVITADLAPFKGDLKVILDFSANDAHASAALRLKESEDESCLWRLRCDSETLLNSINSLLV